VMERKKEVEYRFWAFVGLVSFYRELEFLRIPIFSPYYVFSRIYDVYVFVFGFIFFSSRFLDLQPSPFFLLENFSILVVFLYKVV